MRLWLSILLVYLFVPSWSGAPRAQEPDPRVPFAAEPVVLFAGAPTRKRLGAMTFIRGYRLVSSDSAFGGFSSIRTDGRHFTLLSDSGEGVRFALGSDGALTQQSAFTLPDGPGTGWEKSDRDSESMAVDPATGEVWVGFESSNEIWRYAAGFARVEAHVAPPAMADWPENRGAESLMRLRDGRFVAIGESESWPGQPGRAGIVFAADPTRNPRRGFRFSYVAPENFKPTDIAELPDGRWIAVNRRFDLLNQFTACVTIIDTAGLKPGAVLRGREIARFEGPALHDNFEGIAVVRKGAATHLWIVADDNQLGPWQRSLLLEFRLDEAKPRPTTGPRRKPRT